MAIRRLPDGVIDKIRSAANVTSLNQVVSGLVKNTLDAKASKIVIYIDYARGNVTVEDNGEGIEPSEFGTEAGLLQPYNTSRYPPNPQLHGRRGLFLASIAALSLIGVSSRHFKARTHSWASAHHGRTLSSTSRAPPEHHFLTFSHGTRVAVSDLFGSMPVRVKYRATTYSDRAGIDRELRRLAHHIASLLIAWPAQVAVAVHETKYEKYHRISSQPSSTDNARLLLQQIGLAPIPASSWVPVSASAGDISVAGYISLEPVATRFFQVLALGISPLTDEYGNNLLYEEVNKTFGLSTFGVEDAPREYGGRQGDLKKPSLRKGVERWPAFFLQIHAQSSSPSIDDTSSPPDRQLGAILQLLQVACYGFLKAHHFQPKKQRKSKRHDSISEILEDPGTKAKPQEAIVLPRRSKRIQPTRPNPDDHFGNTIVSRNGGLLGMPFPDVVTDASNSQSELPEADRQLLTTLTLQSGNALAPWLQRVLKDWENPTFKPAELRPPALETFAHHPTTNSNVQCCVNFETNTADLHGRLSRAALAKANVVAQVDCKFILIMLPINSAFSDQSTLVMVDQHAADERCRLEDLMRNYFELHPQSSKQVAIVEALEEPISLQLSAEEGRLLQQRHTYLESWGICYDILPSDDALARVVVSKLPPAIIERCLAEEHLLVNLLRQEAWKQDDFGGSSSQPLPSHDGQTEMAPGFHGCPPGILELLYSRSCRSAIMFNDELTLDDCNSLIASLARCSLPFQCAHGRPSMIPVLDLGSGQRLGAWQGTHTNTSLHIWQSWMEKN